MTAIGEQCPAAGMINGMPAAASPVFVFLRSIAAAFAVLTGALLLTGCTDVRPTVKVGVLAPFEGLHRRSGYAALEAVRAAITDFSAAEVGILPLALDSGDRPEQAIRSAQKLLADPRVAAVVGPLTPEQANALQPLQSSSAVAWFPPHSIAGERWAIGLVQAAAELASQQGCQGLVLAGWTRGWPALTEQQWSDVVELPARLDDDPSTVAAGEAVFWLGSAEDAAVYLQRLRSGHPQAVFILGPQGEDPVFAERAAGHLAGVYWTIWTDAGYNQWAATHSLHSPGAYIVYRSALAALQVAAGQSQDAESPSWYVEVFRFDAGGKWSPVTEQVAVP